MMARTGRGIVGKEATAREKDVDVVVVAVVAVDVLTVLLVTSMDTCLPARFLDVPVPVPARVQVKTLQVRVWSGAMGG